MRFKYQLVFKNPGAAERAKVLKELEIIGYKISSICPDWNRKEMVTFPDKVDMGYKQDFPVISCFDNYIYKRDFILRIPYNLELIKALAAVREDDKFYVGEPVIFLPHVAERLNTHTEIWNKPYFLIVEKIAGGCLYFSKEQVAKLGIDTITGMANLQQCFRKATAEEIIKHYIPHEESKKKKIELPEKWCIKGCRETEEWQRIDMGNKCNWRFDAFRRYYFTTDPELRIWNHTTTIPMGYTEITFEQFKEHILKQSVMKKITLKRSQLLVAYEHYTCGRWKAVITNLLMNNPLAKDNDDIDVSEGIGILKKEGTEEQKKYVESLGIAFEEDKNAFVKKFDDNVLGDISNKLFGNKNVLQIAHSATDDNNLKGRSLYISKSYIVELLPPSVGHSGTVIRIEKK